MVTRETVDAKMAEYRSVEVLLEFCGSRNEVALDLDNDPLSKLQKELRQFETHLVLETKTSTAVFEEGEAARPVYLLQRWSEKWNCFVDVGHTDGLRDGVTVTAVHTPGTSASSSGTVTEVSFKIIY